MLRAVPMVHMQIQVPNREAAVVTRHIAGQGLLHLIDIAHGRLTTADGAPPGTQEQLAAFRDLGSRIRGMAERLDVALPDPAGRLNAGEIRDFAEERRTIDALVVPLEDAVDALWRTRTDARERAAAARRRLAHGERLVRAGLDLPRLARLEFTAVALGLIGVDELPSLAAVLAPAPFAIVPLDVSDGIALAAVAVPASVRDRLDSGFRVVSFEPIPLDDAPALAPDAARREVAAAEGDEQRAVTDLAALRDRAQATIVDLFQRAELGTLLIQAQTHFAAAGRFVVISGWIPEGEAARLTRSIAAVTDGRAVVDVQKPHDLPEALAHSLRIPILHRNPVLLRPFQALVQMYGVPSYSEVQPTAFFAVSFLVMFGLMFGDAGQGLVLFSAGYCLFRYLPRFLDYGILLMECGLASTVFGVLYGSVFGVEGLLPVLWLEPMHDLPRFMVVAVGFGVVLVSAGLLLNIVNSWRAGERASALTGPRGAFGALVYWIALALAARALMPAAVVVPAPLLLGMGGVAALLLVLKGPIVRLVQPAALPARTAEPGAPRWLTALEASIELVDALFAFFANTISFVRIAAFAAVHAGVFIALFALADTLSQSRFGQPFGIATLVVGNVVMILLEGLTVSVQVLRLEYFEFFGKFFRGGGELYRPLMLRKGGV